MALEMLTILNNVKKENKISQVSKFSKQHLKSKIRKASLIPMNIWCDIKLMQKKMIFIKMFNTGVQNE